MGVCGKEAERVFGCAPTSSVHSHCSPHCVPPHITALPPDSLTTHNNNQEFKRSPLKFVLLGRQRANTCLQENRQWQMGIMLSSAPSTSKREMTFILSNSSLARHRQCNLNQPLRYHGKAPFDLSSLEMGVQILCRKRKQNKTPSCSHDFHQDHWAAVSNWRGLVVK